MINPYHGQPNGQVPPNGQPYGGNSYPEVGPHNYGPQGYNSYSAPYAHEYPFTEAKSKIVAALLAFFLGSFGVHNFYLGFQRKAITQLVLTLVGYATAIILVGIVLIFAVAVWAFVEFVIILIGSEPYVRDGNGIPIR